MNKKYYEDITENEYDKGYNYGYDRGYEDGAEEELEDFLETLIENHHSTIFYNNKKYWIEIKEINNDR